MGIKALFLLLVMVLIGCTKVIEEKNETSTNFDPTPKVRESKAVAKNESKKSQEIVENKLPTMIEEKKIAKPKSILKKKKRVVRKKRRAVKKTQKKTVADKVITKAAAITKSIKNIKSEDKVEKKSKFSGNVKFEGETDFNTTDNDDKYYGSSLTIGLGYQISENYKTKANIIIEKDLSGGYEEKMSGLDSKISLSRKAISLSDNLKLAPSTGLIIPTSKNSKVRDEMTAGIEVNPALVYSMSDSTTFTYLPRLRRDFHKYTTSRTNKMLTEYKAVQFFILTYQISKKWVFEPALLYSKKWSYSGRQKNDSYLAVLELNYNINEKTTWIIGTLNGGAYYQTEQGPDKDIEVFDENNTSFYTGVNMAF